MITRRSPRRASRARPNYAEFGSSDTSGSDNDSDSDSSKLNRGKERREKDGSDSSDSSDSSSAEVSVRVSRRRGKVVKTAQKTTKDSKKDPTKRSKRGTNQASRRMKKPAASQRQRKTSRKSKGGDSDADSEFEPPSSEPSDSDSNSDVDVDVDDSDFELDKSESMGVASDSDFEQPSQLVKRERAKRRSSTGSTNPRGLKSAKRSGLPVDWQKRRSDPGPTTKEGESQLQERVRLQRERALSQLVPAEADALREAYTAAMEEEQQQEDAATTHAQKGKKKGAAPKKQSKKKQDSKSKAQRKDSGAQDEHNEEEEEEEEDVEYLIGLTPNQLKTLRKDKIAIKKYHPALAKIWSNLVITDPKDIPKSPQPEELLVDLLPFQREGVAWMIHQEKHSTFSGGILADEMGMGKTVQTISLLLLHRVSPTLVVCPVVALYQWKLEIERKTKPNTLKVLVYHGHTRERDIDILQGADVVLTTYSVVESEHRRETSGFMRKGVKCTESSVLHSVDWQRIVLDEAHFVKSASSGRARAAFNLDAKYKWSLTGTPLQNRVGELFSLVKLLSAYPFSFYFCKSCTCELDKWIMMGIYKCPECGHAASKHFGWWNRTILTPIQKFGTVGPGKRGFEHLRTLLSAIMLRRTKAERGSELGLPPRIIHTRRDLFSNEEEDFYKSLFSESQTKFEAYVQSGTVLNNYAHIFELIMRMRQSVNHPWLVTHRAASNSDKDVCGICHDVAEDAIRSSCKHVFCREEIKLYLDSSCEDKPVCPVCFTPISIDLQQPAIEKFSIGKKRKSIVSRLDLEQWQSSTKIEALMEELHDLQSDSRCVKSIVFSQFTQFLDLLEWRLKRGGIKCVKLDGSMSATTRGAVIDAFNTNPDIRVFLISLKAGGLALNLTAASRVYIMDPWWNPYAESQAMDRIHRLGQHRPIEVRRLIIENSIESRIDILQEKKQLLFESTVGKNAAALRQLSEEDLQFLFSG